MGQVVIAIIIFFSSGLTAQEKTEVTVSGETLIIDGPLETGLWKQIQAMDTSHVKKLKISSGGGDTNEGMNIGEFVRDRRLAVEVDGLCLSSCANYIFTAGATKHVGILAGFICYHGNVSTSWPTRDHYKNALRKAISENNIMGFTEDKIEEATKNNYDAQVDRERKFFSSIGISPIDLFNLENYPGFDLVCPTERGFARFGVKNIEGLTSRGLHIGNRKIFIDDGINGIQKNACEQELRQLRERVCKNVSDFECLAKNKNTLGSTCISSLGLSNGVESVQPVLSEH